MIFFFLLLETLWFALYLVRLVTFKCNPTNNQQVSGECALRSQHTLLCHQKRMIIKHSHYYPFIKSLLMVKKNLSCFSHFFFLLNYYSFHWLSFLYCLSRQMKIPNKCIFTMKVSRYLDYDCEVSQIFKSAQLSMLPLWTVRAVLHWKAQSTQWVPQIWEHQHKAGWIVWECALEKTHEIGFTLVFSWQNYFWCSKQYNLSYHQAKINLCFSFWYFIQI